MPELLDLTTIALPDLKALITVFSEVGKRGNKFFEDQFVILSRVALQSHEMSEMSEYRSEDLVDAVGYLKAAIDGLGNYPDDHPGKKFLAYSLSAALTELERRARKERIKPVK